MVILTQKITLVVTKENSINYHADYSKSELGSQPAKFQSRNSTVVTLTIGYH